MIRGIHWQWPVAFAAAVILTAGCGGDKNSSTAPAQGTNAPAAAGGKRGAGQQQTMISTVAAYRGDIGVYIQALGIVTPLNTVSVQSRVAGQIMKVEYQEGQRVSIGNPLIEIDPAPYQAALDQAEGQLARDTALLANANLDLERYQQAFESNAIPKQQLDTQKATVQQDEGIVRLDKGNRDSASVNLAYCHITSPINGRVGLRLVDPGNIVQAAGSSPLLVITQLQPITVIFNVAEDFLPQIQAAMRQGRKILAEAYDRAQQRKIATGTLETLDNQIDAATGTLKLRALFTNDDESLFPNQFVNVNLLVDTHANVVLLPNAAIQHNDDGAFVYLLQPDQSVTMKPITAGTTDGALTEVEGLDAGQVVAADNFNRLTEGAKVTVRASGGGALEKGGNAGPRGKGQGKKNSQ